ncbi:hypothetical protein JAAARDRAFT_93667, partial [Jaapia argillacea MUCL 33604]
KWNRFFFQHATLQQLGLVVQLRHSPGQRCTHGWSGHKNFIVLDTNGIHQVNILFCGCGSTPAA